MGGVANCKTTLVTPWSWVHSLSYKLRRLCVKSYRALNRSDLSKNPDEAGGLHMHVGQQ